MSAVFLLVAAVIFGLYCKFIFEEQSTKRDQDHIASFFPLNKYLSEKNLETYSNAFGCLSGFGAFAVLYWVSRSPKLLEELDKFLYEKLKALSGQEVANVLDAAHKALPDFTITLSVSVVFVILFNLQLRSCVKFVRDKFHLALGFKSDVQSTLEVAAHAVLSKNQPHEIERKLEERFGVRAPRPRELVRDHVRIVQYQLMYYSSFSAPQYGFNEALRATLEPLNCSDALKSGSKTWNFDRALIIIAFYNLIFSFYVLLIPMFSGFISNHLAWNWPLEESRNALGFQVVRMSLQVCLPLLLGITIFDIRIMRQEISDPNGNFKTGIFALQILFSCIFGLIFNSIDIFRSMSGDTQDSIGSLPNVLLDALLPCTVAPLVMVLWISQNRIRRSPSKIFKSALIGGVMLSLFELRYEIMSKKLKKIDMYFCHDFVLGFFLIGVSLSLVSLVGGLVSATPTVRRKDALGIGVG